MPWIILLFLLFEPTTQAFVNAKQCLKVQPKIVQLERKMRQGYSLKQGERYNKKLRQLKQLRYQCMKKRLATGPKTQN